MSIKDECSACGASNSTCETHLRRHGKPCCNTCYETSTHRATSEKSSVYKVGQRVRIEFPNGSVVEGVLKEQKYNMSPSVEVPRAGGEITKWQPGAALDGRTVTILSEPRPEEPTGLGAVVEARLSGTVEWTFVRVYPSDHGAGSHLWRVVDPNARLSRGFYRWGDLVDPVVLSEGWTP